MERWVAAIAVVVVAVAAVLDRAWYVNGDSQRYSVEMERKVAALCGKAVHWTHVAEQDSAPAVAALHYAVALATLADAVEISDATAVGREMGIDAARLAERLRRRQASRFREAFRACPDAAPKIDLPLAEWV